MIDIILSFFGLVLLAPVFIMVTVWVKIDSKGPVLFSQKRIGKNKAYFNILKFRTMRVDTPKDIPTHLLNNPLAYITKSGRILRKTSLDELPQLWNILIGQMSIIGPRPALWNQDDLITERDKYGINKMRPGLTGWAQINGRDELEIKTKVLRDREYLENLTFKMDFICFFMTISCVLRHVGMIEGGTGMLAKQKAEIDGKVAVSR